MNEILVRIRIKHIKGADILYTTDKSVLENFGLEHDKEFQDIRVIKKGTEIQVDNRLFRVVDMYTNFYDQINDNDEKKGSSLVGTGDIHAFNFDITYYVETIE